jgi:hypothetical protein
MTWLAWRRVVCVSNLALEPAAPFSDEVFSGFVSSTFVPFVGGLLFN